MFDRCDQPDDWIKTEVTLALQEQKNIIPVFTGVDRFPSNMPGDLYDGGLPMFNGVCRSGGGSWKDTLRSYLTSDKLYVLSVAYKDDGIRLDDKSVDILKGIYRILKKTGSPRAKIIYDFSNTEDIARFYTEKASRAAGQRVSSAHARDLYQSIFVQNEDGLSENEKKALLAIQLTMKQISDGKTAQENAACFLLEDRTIDNYGHYFKEKYASRYKHEDCFYYYDDDGTRVYYWLPFLWVDIIERMLPEMFYDVREEQRVSLNVNYLIDGFFNESGTVITYFRTCLPADSETKSMYTDLQFAQADIGCIPVRYLFEVVYPRFFYHLGELKTNDAQYAAVSRYRDKGVFDLGKYRFGLS